MVQAKIYLSLFKEHRFNIPDSNALIVTTYNSYPYQINFTIKHVNVRIESEQIIHIVLIVLSWLIIFKHVNSHVIYTRTSEVNQSCHIVVLFLNRMIKPLLCLHFLFIFKRKPTSQMVLVNLFKTFRSLNWLQRLRTLESLINYTKFVLNVERAISVTIVSWQPGFSQKLLAATRLFFYNNFSR